MLNDLTGDGWLHNRLYNGLFRNDLFGNNWLVTVR